MTPTRCGRAASASTTGHRRHARWTVGWTIACALLTAPWPAVAASASPRADGASEARTEPTTPRVSFRWREHPGVRIGPHVRLDVTARIEGDVRARDADADTDWARRRVGIDASLWKRLAFSVERELTDSSMPWRDVYLNLTLVDALEVRVGHFKVPFGAEQLTSSGEVAFAQRALLSDSLAPGRDTGVMVHGRLWRKRLSYRAGYFTQDGRQARSRTTKGGRDARAARVVVSPFRLVQKDGTRRWLNVELGAGAVSSTLDEGAHGLDGRTALFQDRFFSPMYVSGRRWRTGADVNWRLPRTVVAVEGVRVNDQRAGQGIFDDSLPSVVSAGWAGSAVWTLRRGTRWRGEGPRLGVFDERAGAIELAGRLEALRFSTPNAEGQAFLHPRAPRIPTVQARVVTLGANWYPLPFTRVQVDAVRESVSGSPALSALQSARRAWGGHVRLQILF